MFYAIFKALYTKILSLSDYSVLTSAMVSVSWMLNIKEYKIADYRNLFSCVFQDFQLYAATVAENVLMSRTTDSNADAVAQALIDCGFGDRLKDMSNGVRTNLTREFDNNGTNLSGGEY
jgi:ATP-binding cassette subfamily B protein